MDDDVAGNSNKTKTSEIASTVSTPDSSSAPIGIAGTYKARFPVSPNYFVGRHTAVVKIEQNGNKIVGAFEKNLGSFTGYIEGDSVSFE